MVLVTGGTGLVGSHLLLALARGNEAVRAIHRPGSDLDAVRYVFSLYNGNPEYLFNKIDWVPGDMEDPESLYKALKGIHQVYHCAAMVSFDPRDKARMIRCNVEGTSHLVNACLETGICRIKDDMQSIYPELEQADVIVLASPIQFLGLSAHTKTMVDRCQCLWARKYVLKVPPLGDSRPRKGFFVSVGGTKFKNLFEAAKIVVKSLFIVLDIQYTGELLFKGIDEKGAIKGHPDALKQAFEAGERLVEE